MECRDLVQNVGMKPWFLAGLLVFSLSSRLLAQQVKGIPRFSEVNPHLYRGGQPTLSALEALAKLGVVTVLDLRVGGERGVAEEREAKTLGMHYLNVPLNGLRAPRQERIDRVMAMLQDSKNWPVFVHCLHGVDRTGTVIACYRIAFDFWPNERAEKEAEGRGMHSAERGMKKFILNFHPAAPAPSTALAAGAAALLRRSSGSEEYILMILSPTIGGRQPSSDWPAIRSAS
jgi:protein-tyrosine phosphatase